MKKNFNAQEATKALFTNSGETEPIKEKPAGRAPARKKYRYNLTVDDDLNGFMRQMAWLNHTSITQYLNDLLRAEKEKFLNEGGQLDHYFDDLGAKK